MIQTLETIKGRYSFYERPWYSRDGICTIDRIDDNGKTIERIKEFFLTDMIVSPNGIITVRTSEEKMKEIKKMIRIYEEQ